MVEEFFVRVRGLLKGCFAISLKTNLTFEAELLAVKLHIIIHEISFEWSVILFI